MILTVQVSTRAREDVKTQFRWYLENADEQIAQRYFDSFEETVELLKASPWIGRLRCFNLPELTGLRSLALRGRFQVHLAFDRVDDSHLIVERVLHGARDLERRLVEAPGE